MRRVAHVDSNQAEIVAALRGAGCTVMLLHEVGRGVPDLLVGRGGVNYLIEVKGTDGRMRRGQPIWHELWRGQAAVAHSVDEALAIIGVRRCV